MQLGEHSDAIGRDTNAMLTCLVLYYYVVEFSSDPIDPVCTRAAPAAGACHPGCF